VADYARNVVAWDSVRHLSYAYDKGDSTLFVGLKWLNGGTAACYAINVNAPAGSPVQLSNGFSRAEKHLTLSSGTRQTSISRPNGTDIAHVLGAALPHLAPTDSAVVAFAVLAAPTLAQLQAAADAAQTRYNQVLPVRPSLAADAWEVYPNPASSNVRVEVSARFGGREVRLSNPLGQVLRRTVMLSNAASLDVSNLPPGMYIVRVYGTTGEMARRIIVR
jgi:hypothetical protein